MGIVEGGSRGFGEGEGGYKRLKMNRKGMMEVWSMVVHLQDLFVWGYRVVKSTKMDTPL